MGHIYSKAKKEQQIELANEILDYLNQVKDSDNWKALLLDKIHAMEVELDESPKKVYEKQAWDFSQEKAAYVFASDGDLTIRPLQERDKSFYYAVRQQWDSALPESMFDQENGLLWKPTQEESSFFCVVEQQSHPVGYVAIHDTRVSPWELAVEFDKAFCNKGLGPRTIKLFLSKIEEITLISLFRARVEVDNIACQKCMTKIGADLVGLGQGVLKTEEEMRKFEEENIGLIDEHMISLAEKLNVDPRKLLSHVLEYEIQM